MPYHLSYIQRKKTEKLLELKARLDPKPHLKYIAVAGVLGLYICWFNERYFFYLYHLMLKTPFILAAPLHTPQFMAIVDGVAFLAFLIFTVIAYYRSKDYQRLKQEFESLRRNLVQAIDADFCQCKTACDCKDEYVQDMERQGINLFY
ncbi:hypothetical protein EDC14_100129 [Hydrogenispora ethanolica]|jgi:hypothetical protein|uniref:DUF2663 family protein n=1 Tax=Hydrogenispora ethanolica TaxID=1082276 RepID=A0A4R1SBG2_HYDET|nr:hypothetical protein [Hydrogenispora ethanolica]TCL76749.1 hypothetical protein EDC14_100129 [Hydrogenispora ethanolica]